jgi:mRNA interferase RelE/StbE
VEVRELVVACLSGLQETPKPTGCIKMKNVSGYRIRISDYRVLYDVDDAAQTVILRRVGHRKEIYRGLYSERQKPDISKNVGFLVWGGLIDDRSLISGENYRTWQRDRESSAASLNPMDWFNLYPD